MGDVFVFSCRIWGGKSAWTIMAGFGLKCKIKTLIKHVFFLFFSGANILRGVAGAGVLSGFDKFKEVYMAWRLG